MKISILIVIQSALDFFASFGLLELLYRKHKLIARLQPLNHNSNFMKVA